MRRSLERRSFSPGDRRTALLTPRNSILFWITGIQYSIQYWNMGLIFCYKYFARLVPDAAFMIGPLEETSVWTKKKEKVDILFLLRGDRESKYPEYRDQATIRNILEENPLSAHLSFDVVDWWDNNKYLDLALMDPPAPQFEHKVLNYGKFDYKVIFQGHNLQC